MKIKRIDYSDGFDKGLKKSPLNIKIAFRKRLVLFSKDKFNSSLNNHPLVGKFKGYRSINITGDWRAIFRELEYGEVIYFDTIGTHSQLYK